MLDHPLQFFVALGLLVGLVVWRIHAGRRRKEKGLGFTRWQKWLEGILVGMVALTLLIVAMEATRFVGINFCLDLWSDQTWCNHDESD